MFVGKDTYRLCLKHGSNSLQEDTKMCALPARMCAKTLLNQGSAFQTTDGTFTLTGA